MTPKAILIPISPAELIDRITILEIKQEVILDPQKRKNIDYELGLLSDVHTKELPTEDERLSSLHEELKMINKSIWDSEDEVRAHWDDDERFVAAAKNSHYKNDERARVKNEINMLLGSRIFEEKSHPEYEHEE